MTVYKVIGTVKKFIAGREREIEVCCVYSSRHLADECLTYLQDHRVPARLMIEEEEE